MTDQQTLPPPPTVSTATTEQLARADAHLARWRELTDEAAGELAAAMAIMLGRPDPSDTPIDRFVCDLQEGDHVLHADGWWVVAAKDWYTPELAAIGSGTVLTLERVGHVPLELRLPDNTLFTTVRAR